MSDDGPLYMVEGELGSLRLDVRGVEKEWVEKEFDRQMDKMLKEAGEMRDAIQKGDKSSY